jgi:hypothetical protein
LDHELKISPQDYARIKNGSKTFEIRGNGPSFQSGDTVTLKEWDPQPINATTKEPKGYTDSQDLKFQIGHVHVLDSSTVVFSLLTLKNNKQRK